MTGLTFTIASILLAQAVLGQNQCPNGWGATQFNNNDVYCCYGSLNVNNNEGFCCVHGSGGSGAIVIDAGDSCFPSCSESANRNIQIASPSQKCIDNVPFSAADYSQRVSAASKLAVASQAGGSQISSNSASTTKSAAVTQMSGSQTGSNGASATKSPTVTQKHDSQTGSNGASGSNGTSATKSGSSSGAMDTAASSSGIKSSSAPIVITNAASCVTHGLVQVGGIVAVAVMLAI